MALDTEDCSGRETPDRPVLTSLLSTAAAKVESALGGFSFPAEQEARSEAQASSELSSARVPPWATLGEQFAILEPQLKRRICDIATDPARYFSVALAREQRRPGNVMPNCLPMAQAALAEDEALRKLRFRLVPSRLSEEEF